MSERDEPYRPAGGWSVEPTGVEHDAEDWREQTTPGINPVPGHPSSGAGATAAYPSAGGYAPPSAGYGPHSAGYGQAGPDYGPGYGRAEPGYDRADPGYAPAYGQPQPGYGYPGAAATAPEYNSRPVAYRRPDGLAALLLLLAGIAAGISLLLPWARGHSTTGWGLVRQGIDMFSTGVGEVFRSGLWQPLAIVGGGAVLFVLGLLLFIPARTHRFLGLLALLVAAGAGAGVLVALHGVGWQVHPFDVGFWFGVAVPVLGVLGAIKALLTGPRASRG